MKDLAKVFFALSILGLAFSANAKESIKIGALVSATGPASFLGDPEQKTLELYVKKINQNGGVLGKQLELVTYDTGANPKKAIGFIKRLINQDKVVAVIGDSSSGATMAVIPFAQKSKIPLISMAGAIEIIKPVKKFVFKTPATDEVACRKIFKFLKSQNKTNIALISGTDGFGSSMREQCKKVSGEYDMKILADETYGPSDTDMSAQLTKIKSIKEVQAVINPGFGQGPAIVAKNYKQLAIEPVLIESHGVASKKFIELAGDASEGILISSPPVVVANLLDDKDPVKKVALDYIKDYEAEFKIPTSTFGGYAYDALFLLVQGIKNANSTEPEKIRDGIEKVQNYAGLNGIFNMSKDDHMGLDIDSGIRMLVVKNGDWALAE